MSKRVKKRKTSMKPILQDFTVTSLSDLNPDVDGPSDTSLFEEIKNYDVQVKTSFNQTDIDLPLGSYPSDSSLDNLSLFKNLSYSKLKDVSNVECPFKKRSTRKSIQDSLFNSLLNDSNPDSSVEHVRKPFQRKSKKAIDPNMFDQDLNDSQTNTTEESPFKKPFQRQSKIKQKPNLFDSVTKDSLTSTPDQQPSRPFQRKSKKAIDPNMFDEDLNDSQTNTTTEESPFKKPLQRRSKFKQKPNLFDSFTKDSVTSTPDHQPSRPLPRKSKKSLDSNLFSEDMSTTNINQSLSHQDFITRRTRRTKNDDSDLFLEDLNSSQSDVSLPLKSLGFKYKKASNHIKRNTGIFDDVFDITKNESQDESLLMLRSSHSNEGSRAEDTNSFNLEYIEETDNACDISKDTEEKEFEKDEECKASEAKDEEIKRPETHNDEPMEFETEDEESKESETEDDKTLGPETENKEAKESEAEDKDSETEDEEEKESETEDETLGPETENEEANESDAEDKESETEDEEEKESETQDDKKMGLESEDDETMKLETDDEGIKESDENGGECKSVSGLSDPQDASEHNGNIKFKESGKQKKCETGFPHERDLPEGENTKNLEENCGNTNSIPDLLCQNSPSTKNSAKEDKINKILTSSHSTNAPELFKSKDNENESILVVKLSEQVNLTSNCSINRNSLNIESEEHYQYSKIDKTVNDFIDSEEVLPNMVVSNAVYEQYVAERAHISPSTIKLSLPSEIFTNDETVPDGSFKDIPSSSTPSVKGKRVSFLLQTNVSKLTDEDNNHVVTNKKIHEDQSQIVLLSKNRKSVCVDDVEMSHKNETLNGNDKNQDVCAQSVTNNTSSNKPFTGRKSLLRTRKGSNNSLKDNSICLKKRRVSFKVDNETVTQSQVQNNDKLKQSMGNQSNNYSCNISLESLIYEDPSESETPNSDSNYIDIHPSQMKITSSSCSDTDLFYRNISNKFQNSGSCSAEMERCDEKSLNLESSHLNNEDNYSNKGEKSSENVEIDEEQLDEEERNTFNETLENEELDREIESEKEESEDEEEENEDQNLTEGRQQELGQLDLEDQLESQNENNSEKGDQLSEESSLGLEDGSVDEEHDSERTEPKEFYVNNDVTSGQDENLNPQINESATFKIPNLGLKRKKKVRSSSIFNENPLEVPSKSQLKDMLNRIPFSELKGRNKRKYSEHCVSKEQLQQYEIEEELRKNQQQKNSQNKVTFTKPSSNKLKRPKKWVSPKLYDFIIKKLEPQYGIRSRVQAEELVLSLVDHVERIKKKKELEREDVEEMKSELARLGIVRTHWDFFLFVDHYLDFFFKRKMYPTLPGMGHSAFDFGPANVMENIL